MYVHDTYGRICTVVYMMSTIHTYVHMFISMSGTRCLLNVYGVATVSRIHKITGLFCRMSSLLQGSFAKPTYNFIDPTNHSHPVVCTGHIWAHICIVVHYMCIMHMYASLRVVWGVSWMCSMHRMYMGAYVCHVYHTCEGYMYIHAYLILVNTQYILRTPWVCT